MTLRIPGLSRLAAPAIALLVTSLGSPALPAEPDPGSRRTDSTHAFSVVNGEILSLGRGAGEGGLELVTATLTTGDILLEVGLAPPSVLVQTGFTLKAGDLVEVRLSRSPGDRPAAQSIHNRTSRHSLRLRSIQGEPLWDGDGVYRGGNCPRHLDAVVAAPD